MFYDIDQNTPEWESVRLGRFTASMFKSLFMGKTTKGYQSEIERIVSERLTGEKEEEYSGGWAERGHKMEIEAKEWYQREYFTKIKNGGFWIPDNDISEWVGCSPDGLIGDKIVEIKSLAGKNIISALRNKEVPSEYTYQIQGQLWVTGKEECIFIAYHPKLPKLVLLVKRDEELITKIEKEVRLAIKEAQNILNKL